MIAKEDGMNGMIWRYDHAELLSLEEYNYWMRRALPFGWAILSTPF